MTSQTLFGDPEPESKPQKEWDSACKGYGSTRGKYHYEFDEVTSAMQKMIRANKPYEACYWAFILHDSGYYKYVWKRLVVIATEDCGGEVSGAVVVNNLRLAYEYAVDSKARASDKIGPNTYIFQAVHYLCRLPKNRQNDSLATLFSEGFEDGSLKQLEIPEVAIDPHTTKGKKIHGRWNDGSPADILERLRKWVYVWSKGTPINEKNVDPYMPMLEEKWGLKK